MNIFQKCWKVGKYDDRKINIDN